MTLPRWYEELLDRRDDPSAALELTKRFLSATDSERTEVVRAWNPLLVWATPNPWRLACASERPGDSRERILVNLLFQALHIPSAGDIRESIMGLAVAFNSCELAGLNPVEVFEEVAQAVRGSAGNELLAFAKRDPEDRSMDAFALTAVEDPAGGYELSQDWLGLGEDPAEVETWKGLQDVGGSDRQ